MRALAILAKSLSQRLERLNDGSISFGANRVKDTSCPSYRHPILDTILPECRRREFFSDDSFGSKEEAGGGGHLSTRRVVKGQMAVDDILGGEADRVVTGIHSEKLSEERKVVWMAQL